MSAHAPSRRARGAFVCENEVTARVRELNRAHITSLAAQRRTSQLEVAARVRELNRAHATSTTAAAVAKEMSASADDAGATLAALPLE
eukprot:1613443-Prymnesium_polylepis.1